MRILLVNDYPPGSGGGTEVHVQRLAAGLRDHGHQVELFAGKILHRGPGRLLDVWDPVARRRLAAVASSFGPDVMHHHNVLRELSASVLGIPRGVATVMTVHDLQLLGIMDGSGRGDRHTTRDSLRPAKLFKTRFDRFVAARAVDLFIAASHHMEERLRAAGFANVRWVPSFAPLPGATGSAPSASSDLLFAGRLVPEKGVRVLLDAFERVTGQHPDARLLVAGEGPEREWIATRAAALANGRIRLLGRLDERDLREVMSGVRAVVAPSVVTEGAGLTVVEAALAGRPVVVSDDPGLRELVDEAGCGSIVPRGDVAALSNALNEVLADPSLADTRGAAGRQAAERSRTVAHAVSATLDAYRAAIELAHAD